MIQCFVKRNFTPSFKIKKEPKLLYVSKTGVDDSITPRVMHAHEDTLEIILISSGTGEYSIGGKKHNVKEADLIIYNSNVVHDEISGPDCKVERYCCAINDIEISGLRKNALIKDGDNPIFNCGSQYSSIRTIYELMFSELCSGSSVAEEACHHLMLSLLTMVWNIIHRSPNGAIEEDMGINMLGKRIRNYIDKNYSEDISLQSISEELNISPYYLSHVFKKMTGYSPLQYILRRRIGEAQTLLITTNLPITTIASKVGYNNTSHFNMLFTKNVGKSPRKYRKDYILMNDERLE